jgi:hypothetical protein
MSFTNFQQLPSSSGALGGKNLWRFPMDRAPQIPFSCAAMLLAGGDEPGGGKTATRNLVERCA